MVINVIQVGALLRDRRRINVLLTRARFKLVIFGSRKTLATAPFLKELLQLLERQHWVLPLPFGADTAHEYLSMYNPRKRSADDLFPGDQERADKT